jgi:hypothetical protein
MQRGLIKRCIHNITHDLFLSVLGDVHKTRVTKLKGAESENLGGSTMFIALFVILLLLWIFGWTTMHVASFAIHLLLILAIVSLVVHFARPHSRPPAA